MRAEVPPESDNPSEEWRDCSDPFIEEEPCSSCLGKGKLAKELMTPCPTCSGQGCVVSPGAALKICPTCKGTCSVKMSSFITCTECEGLGLLVFLCRKQRRLTGCDACNGHGKVTSSREVDKLCDGCEGSGLGEKRIISTQLWISIKGSKVKRRNFHEKSGYSRPCPNCHSAIDADCPECDGIGRVIVVFPVCQKCNGTSRVAETIKQRSACSKCNRTGTIQHDRVIRARKIVSKLPKLDIQ